MQQSTAAAQVSAFEPRRALSSGWCQSTGLSDWRIIRLEAGLSQIRQTEHFAALSGFLHEIRHFLPPESGSHLLAGRREGGLDLTVFPQNPRVCKHRKETPTQEAPQDPERNPLCSIPLEEILETDTRDTRN